MSGRWRSDVSTIAHGNPARHRTRRQRAHRVAPAPPVPVGDDGLIERLRHGDTSAGEMLVQRYCQPLMRYLRRIAGAQAAEELHQQTWLSVLSHLDGFATATPGGSFKAWLFRIATNKAKDQWRSAGREKAAKKALRYADGELANCAGAAVELAEQGEKLVRALERLPEVQRQAIVLRYYTDLKFVEIADVLGCPLNTALTRVHKALIKLRQLMEHAPE